MLSDATEKPNDAICQIIILPEYLPNNYFASGVMNPVLLVMKGYLRFQDNCYSETLPILIGILIRFNKRSFNIRSKTDLAFDFTCSDFKNVSRLDCNV